MSTSDKSRDSAAHDNHTHPISEGGVCVYLGLADDRETWLSYPSPGNFCHLLGKAVDEDHQQSFCLSSRCAECPFVQQPVVIPASRVYWDTAVKWGQKASGVAFVWLLLGWMVRLILH